MINRNSRTWINFKKWLIAERAKVVEDLVSRNDDRYRGRIELIDDIIALPDSPKHPDKQDTNNY